MNLQVRIGGLQQVSATLQLLDVAMRDDWELLWKGWIRPTKAPGMAGLVIREQYTLEGSTESAFDHSGRNAFFGGWSEYQNEPRYARAKERHGGGTSVLVWQGSKNPLRKAFLRGHSDHLELVRGQSMVWGAKGEKGAIAQRLAQGGFYQPWDKTSNTPPRPVIRLNEKAALEVLRGMQTILRGRLGREGFKAARREPPRLTGAQ